MRMPEAMPAYNWQAKVPASGLQHSTEKVLRIERRAVAAGKDKGLGVHNFRSSALRQEGIANWLAIGTSLRLCFVLGLPNRPSYTLSRTWMAS